MVQTIKKKGVREDPNPMLPKENGLHDPNEFKGGKRAKTHPIYNSHTAFW